jgi:hypothetical protein
MSGALLMACLHAKRNNARVGDLGNPHGSAIRLRKT